MSKLTMKQNRILTYLLEFPNTWISPTQIGREVGETSEGKLKLPRHSAWACPTLKTICAKRLVERNDDGHYRASVRGVLGYFRILDR